MADTVSNCRVDGVFSDIAFGTEVVMSIGITGQLATLLLHFVCGLPSANDDFAHTSHRLAVRAKHADGA